MNVIETLRYKCPDCGSDVIVEEWTETTADHEGNPAERSGLGYYCTRPECEHSMEPIDDDDFPVLRHKPYSPSPLRYE